MQGKVFYTGTKKPQSDINLLWTPTIAIKYTWPTNRHNLEKAMTQKCRYVFFSKHGVIGFRKYFTLNSSCVIHAVGKKTSELIRETWECSTVNPVEQNACGMIQLFQSLPVRERVTPVVIIQGNKGRKEFSDWLYENKWPFVSTCVYETALHANELLKEQWQNNANDYVLFTSPSTVHGFLHTIDEQNLQNVKSLLMSIGPTTSSAIQECGGKVHYQGPSPNINYLIEACMA